MATTAADALAVTVIAALGGAFILARTARVGLWMVIAAAAARVNQRGHGYDAVAHYIHDMATTLSSVSISFEGARVVMDAAIAKATEMGIDACISVCDPAGHAVLSARMDGAPLLSVDIAANKAYTVVAFKGMPTHLWWGGLKDDPSLVHGLTKTNRFIILGGGIPLRVKKKLVGAIGVSGGSAEQDQAIAEAATAAL